MVYNFIKMKAKQLNSKQILQTISPNYQEDSPFIMAVNKCQKTAKENGTCNISLEEINYKINEVRRNRLYHFVNQ